jgi:hypothetical protein
MQKITSVAGLREEIGELKYKQVAQGQLLKEQFNIVIESLKPVNVIKSTFNDVVASPDLLGNVLNAAIGLTAGIFSKKVLVGSTLNPFKRILGTILEAGIATVVTTKGDTIRNTVLRLFSSLRKKKPEQINENL